MLTLKDLDQAFDNLWLNTQHLPSLLEKWQEMVSEYLSKLEPTAKNLNEFEERMEYWQTVLEENRTLLYEFQKSLKSEIVSGKPNKESIKKAKRYK